MDVHILLVTAMSSDDDIHRMYTRTERDFLPTSYGVTNQQTDKIATTLE